MEAINILKKAMESLQNQAISANDELLQLQKSVSDKSKQISELVVRKVKLEEAIKKLENTENVASKSKKIK